LTQAFQDITAVQNLVLEDGDVVFVPSRTGEQTVISSEATEVIVTGEKPEPRTVRHTFNFYGEKVGDGQLRVRDGNSVLSVKKGDKHWVGGPLHMRMGVAHAGIHAHRSRRDREGVRG